MSLDVLPLIKGYVTAHGLPQHQLRVSTETRTVYRVEHPYDGKGFFNSKKTIYGQLDGFLDLHREFPNPYAEGLNAHGKYCAFINLEDVTKWFPNDSLQRYIAAGFKVYRLVVTDFQIGEYQAVYSKESIKEKENITNSFLK